MLFTCITSRSEYPHPSTRRTGPLPDGPARPTISPLHEMDETNQFSDRTSIRRVVLPLPSSVMNLDVLRAAAQLAGQLRAEILGLFLRDETLLRGAAVPFSQEVRRLPATLTERTPKDIERQMQAQIRRVEALLVQRSREMGVRGRLQVVTGTAVETVRGTAETGDLIVLPPSARPSQPTDALLETLVRKGTHPLLVVPPRPSALQGLTVVVSPTPEGERSLQVAGHVARRLGRIPITLLALIDGQASKKETAQQERELADTYGLAVTTRPLAAFTLPALAEALQRVPHNLLVVPSGLLHPDLESRLHILRALPSPFLITP